MRDLLHLEEDLGGDGVKVDQLACVRRAVWGMLYTDCADIVLKSAEGLAKMMPVIAAVLRISRPHRAR